MCDWKHWLVLIENAAFSMGDSEEKAAFSTEPPDEKAAISWDYYIGLVNRERDDIGF